jgi:serine/threonine protein kinase/tetratricopeptide (TPR) repeat protein
MERFSEQQSKPTVGNRYQLVERIGEGGMGEVYKALDRLNSKHVALKSVKSFLQRDDIADDDIQKIAIAHEFATVAKLRHPHIIRVLDFGFDIRGTYFTMDLLSDPQTITSFQDASFDLKMSWIVQLLQALSYLHSHDIIHRDLKPSNILIDAEKKLKVLDFGLAVQINHARGVTGTLSYMSPEALRDEVLDHRADLYAVGLIMYELLAGRHPFNTHSMSRLISETLNLDPDLDLLEGSREVKMLIDRLLAKQPSDRFATALDTLRALNLAINKTLPLEDQTIRESRLQSAKFIGRNYELSLLVDGLNQAITSSGSAWLIAGESGVGKTRLLSELRIRALVKQVIVVQAGFQESESGEKFWENALRQFLLFTEISEDEAIILKYYLPDIATVINRSVPDIPVSMTEDARQRFVPTVTNILQRQEKPVLFLIEDLHWGELHLKTLRAMMQNLTDAPIMMVGTYRSDEMPYLYGKLPEARQLQLNRFSTDEIEQISVSILGRVDKKEHITKFLTSQTEGNPLFIVETLRTLAVEAGQLDKIGNTPLPENIETEGILDVAKRRLVRLPMDYQPLLRLSAVNGREIDLEIIEYIDDEVDIDDWLQRCIDCAMISVENDKWVFAHDKLREGVLHSLEPKYVSKLNQLTAEAIESVYESQLDKYFPKLVRLWSRANILKKATHYALLSGEQYMNAGLNQEARFVFENVLPLLPEKLEPIQLEMLLQLGRVYVRLGEYHLAVDTFLSVKENAQRLENIDILGDALENLGNIRQRWGNFSEAEALLNEAYRTIKQTQNLPRIAQVLHTLLITLFHQVKFVECMQVATHMLELSHKYQMPIARGRALMMLGLISVRNHRYDEAEQHLREAVNIARYSDDKGFLSNALLNLGNVTHKQNNYQEAYLLLQEALMIQHQVNDEYMMGIIYSNLAHVFTMLDRPEDGMDIVHDGLVIAHHIDSVILQLYLVGRLAELYKRYGDSEYAMQLYRLAVYHPKSTIGHEQEFALLGNSLIEEFGLDTFNEILLHTEMLLLDQVIYQTITNPIHLR